MHQPQRVLIASAGTDDVVLDEEEYKEIQGVARRHRVTLAEWVRQALRQARSDHPGAVDAN